MRTDAAHQRIEARLNAVEQLSGGAREALVARYHAMHAAAERAMDPWLCELDGLDYHARQRAGLFADGAAPDGEPEPSPAIGSVGEALGVLYVMEGSTLGGRMILREIARRGASTDQLRFLDPYGTKTGERWRGFLDVLQLYVGADADRLQNAVTGAQKGFALAERCLCGEGRA